MSCQDLDSSDFSDETITDHIPFTNIPPDITPKEGKVEILSRLSLNGQSLGLTTASNLGINIGEAARLSVSQTDSSQWHFIELLDNYQNPVVIMQPVSYNYGNPSLVRIKLVSSNSFYFQIDEWDYLDGGHGTEELSYLVMEEGLWSFQNGLGFEVGKTIVNHIFKQVNLQQNFNNPVILTQSQTVNGASAITTRQNPNNSGFQVRLQEEEGANGSHVGETVGYIAVSQGQEKLGNVAITAGIKGGVTHNFNIIDFGFAAPVESEEPVFLAGIQSYNSNDPAALRYKNLNTNQVSVRVEEEKSADNETSHSAEDVGYLLLADTLPIVPVWTKQFGTSVGDIARAVAIDSNDNIVVVGYTYGSLEGSNLGFEDVFLNKYDNDGNELWTKQFGTNDSDRAYSLAIDSSDNIIVVGYTEGDLAGSTGLDDAFVRKYDSGGNILWTWQFGTNKDEQATAVAIDSNDNIIVTGYTKGSLQINALGSFDCFVRKFDSAGNILWTRQFGTWQNDQAYAITVDNNNNVIVTGYTWANLAANNQGKSDAFIRKYDTNGNKLWTKQFGNSNYNEPRSIVLDSNNNILLTTRIFPSSTSKHDVDGNELWKQVIGGAFPTELKGTIDSSDNIIVTGDTTLSLAGNKFGGKDAFIGKYNNQGESLWFAQFGTTANDVGRDVVIDSLGNIIVVGDTKGDLATPSAGNNDVFVRKYTYP